MRIIIVGYGPGGLVTGHCLLQGGIDDFVIPEQRPNSVEKSGAALGVWPDSSQVLDKLDMVDEFRKMSMPMPRLIHLDPKGRAISEDNVFDLFAAK